MFVGTRVPFQTLLDYLEAGDPLGEFLDDFPSVSREHAVAALEQAILDYLQEHNQNSKPFVWTADADLILNRVQKVCTRITNSGH